MMASRPSSIFEEDLNNRSLSLEKKAMEHPPRKPCWKPPSPARTGMQTDGGRSLRLPRRCARVQLGWGPVRRRAMRLEGSCHCGAGRFSVESRHPFPFNLCCCSICCKTAGAGEFAINLGAEAASLRIEGGTHLRVYRARAVDPDTGAVTGSTIPAANATRHSGSTIRPGQISSTRTPRPSIRPTGAAGTHAHDAGRQDHMG